jgi:hypothetical protein
MVMAGKEVTWPVSMLVAYKDVFEEEEGYSMVDC